jgi:hypothetical protein
MVAGCWSGAVVGHVYVRGECRSDATRVFGQLTAAQFTRLRQRGKSSGDALRSPRVASALKLRAFASCRDGG